MVQKSRASGAVLAAASYLTNTGNTAPPVDLGMLRNSTRYLQPRSEQMSDVEDPSTRQIKDLTSIFNFVEVSKKIV